MSRANRSPSDRGKRTLTPGGPLSNPQYMTRDVGFGGYASRSAARTRGSETFARIQKASVQRREQSGVDQPSFRASRQVWPRPFRKISPILHHSVPSLSERRDIWLESETPGVSFVLSEARHFRRRRATGVSPHTPSLSPERGYPPSAVRLSWRQNSTFVLFHSRVRRGNAAATEQGRCDEGSPAHGYPPSRV